MFVVAGACPWQGGWPLLGGDRVLGMGLPGWIPPCVQVACVPLALYVGSVTLGGMSSLNLWGSRVPIGQMGGVGPPGEACPLS